jgi:UDP-2-acetamido-2,6-beta-L-arabino-hexul-4-ose reductase
VRHVVVTGARGFIGRNLMVALGRSEGVEAAGFDLDDPPGALRDALGRADLVYHLAGVNRPPDPSDYDAGNAGFTRQVCSWLAEAGTAPIVALTSSTQAELGNAYGDSKLGAERALAEWAGVSGAGVALFRLPNVFGKWCRPNYNSAVATFCHNIARGLPIRVDDRSSKVRLVYIDDVVAAFLQLLDGPPAGVEQRVVRPVHEITVGELADCIQAFHESRHSPDLPDFSQAFARSLYATYLSYLEPEELGFAFDLRTDQRGDLAELAREPHFGQVFVSHTHPGITRGNHYHDTKVERFMVVGGEGVIRLRAIGSEEVREYHVSGAAPQAVIIPPGVTHSIENVGAGEMITLFWADEVFDPQRPDTYYEPVLREERS